MGLKERLKKKRAELAERGSKGNVLYIKEGTTRIRVLPSQGADDLAAEVTHFYLNETLKGIYSASTFDEDCPALEAYQDLKKSDDEDDQELAKRLTPKQAYLIPVVVYEDDKGKKISEDNSGKLMKIPSGVYQSIIDLFLDEDEWGDMTDPKEGYDIKIIRTGKGRMDTEYTVSPCKNTPLDKKWAKKTIDLKKMVKALIEPYDTVQAKINQFLGIDDDDDNKKSKKKSKKAKSGDDDFKSSKKKSKKSDKPEKTSSKKKLGKKK